MLIKVKKKSDVESSEITSESVYNERRNFLKKTGQYALAGLGLAIAGCSDSSEKTEQQVAPSQQKDRRPSPEWLQQKIQGHQKSHGMTDEVLTPYKDVTGYNNFYEFGTGKGDPARYADSLITDPWSVTIEGEVSKSGRYNLEDLVKPRVIEERIYRLRCVEAWSMVIPWIGFSLADLIKKVEPTSTARYVEFTTLYDPQQMRGQKAKLNFIDWPYIEGLRIDEAMNPLTLMAVGLYGKELPSQNGAPLRLVMPWKYGFKSIKSIVKMRFTKHRPKTTWELAGPAEYGFYANVNPEVDHPRWSQKSERRLPSPLLAPNVIKTRKFNGYEEEVADLYKGMDLKEYF